MVYKSKNICIFPSNLICYRCWKRVEGQKLFIRLGTWIIVNRKYAQIVYKISKETVL
jgi:hypothetical protein